MPLSLPLCLRPNQTWGNSQGLGTREGKTLAFGSKIPAITVMLANVSCINFHSFVLGILSDGRQKNITLSDGVYTISTNSTSFQVSARLSNGQISIFWKRTGYLSRLIWNRITICEATRFNSDRPGSWKRRRLCHYICKEAHVLFLSFCNSCLRGCEKR